MRFDLLLDRCVVLLIGSAGSGKSTVAAALVAANPGFAVVSYDAVQRRLPGDDGRQACTALAVDLAHAELAERCAAGLGTVVDGTHRQADRRAAVRTIAAAYGLPTVAVALVVPLEFCVVRQLGRARRVPVCDIEGQHSAITAALPILHDEGYAAVILLTS